MQSPQLFYQSRKSYHKEQLARIKKQLFASSMLRLSIFLLFIFGIYLYYDQPKPIIAIVVLTFGVFLFLVTRHSNLQYKRDKQQALIAINTTEIEVFQRKFDHLPDGSEYLNPNHHYSQDIDLFGRGSFFQYSNRTSLAQGSNMFAQFLLANTTKDIPIKQEAVNELSSMPEWRQNFSATASLVNTETSCEKIIRWMENYIPFTPATFRSIPWIFSVLSAVLIGLYFLDLVLGWMVVGWFFLGLVITVGYLRKISKLASDCTKILSTFQQYQSLISSIEQTKFSSQLLQQKRSAVVGDNERSSDQMKKFARLMHGLDQRNNIIIGLFGNAFMLRDLQLCWAIEGWIAQHAPQVESWFSAVAFFDAFNSLGNFAFNHPDYVFPEIVNGNTVLHVTNGGHPMLQPDIRITNDVEISDKEFYIITGANMAGKSTFLRTVALQIVMANTGLPICASAASYSPVKLITSMRTSDSLTDDESYFFSELKRLKFIVDRIEKERYFIVLDEILKGTNSTDKARGSRKFLERLVATNATGLIATHDLSLCETAEAHKGIKNFYFDAEIIDDTLHFDYKLKNGVCQNMNASFLLKKMGIVD